MLTLLNNDQQACTRRFRDVNNEATLPAVLSLLVPWELPPALDVPASERAPIRDALDGLETLLRSDRSDYQAVNQLIAALPSRDEHVQTLRDTRSPLTADEVSEYDRYFLVNHVHSDTPALSMVHSLLTTCQVFVFLCATDVNLDPETAAVQREGFIEYVGILRRVLGLEGQV